MREHIRRPENGKARPLSIEELRFLAKFRDKRRDVWIRTLPEGEIYRGAILEGSGGVLALWGDKNQGKWSKEVHYGVKWQAYSERPEEKETYTLDEVEKIVLGDESDG